MKPIRLISTAALYFIASFAWGYIWHLILFRHLYDGFMIFDKAPLNPDMGLLVTGTLIESLAFAFLYLRFNMTGGRIGSGITLGICMYLFASSYGVFALAAASHMQGGGNLNFLFIEMVYMILAGIICGTLVGLFIRK